MGCELETVLATFQITPHAERMRGDLKYRQQIANVFSSQWDSCVLPGVCQPDPLVALLEGTSLVQPALPIPLVAQLITVAVATASGLSPGVPPILSIHGQGPE